MAADGLDNLTPAGPGVAELALDLVGERVFRVDASLRLHPINHAARATPLEAPPNPICTAALQRAIVVDEGDVVEVDAEASQLAAIVPLAGEALLVIRDRSATLAIAQAEETTRSFAHAAEAAGIAHLWVNPRGYLAERSDVLDRMAELAPGGPPVRLAALFTRETRASVGEMTERCFDDGRARAIDAELITASGTSRAVRLALAPVRDRDCVRRLVGLLTPAPIQPKP